MTNEDEKDLVQIMQTELHELSQPLTTIRLRLELAMIARPPAQSSDRPSEENIEELSLQATVKGALDDLRRVFVVLERMKRAVLARVSS